MPSAHAVSAAAAALACGLMAGVFFAFWSFVMPALATLEAPRAAAAMNAINAAAVRPLFMTAFLGTALACVTATVLGLRGPSAARVLLMTATALYLAGVLGTTAVFSQPLNLRLAALDDAAAAEYWSHYIVRWTIANLVRTLSAGAGAVIFAVAALRGG